MTEAEALDMAARAAGWEYYNIARYNDGDAESIRAHAKTIVAMAELMTTCEEATTRMELMYLQHQKVVDENAALKAENERLREERRLAWNEAIKAAAAFIREAGPSDDIGNRDAAAALRALTKDSTS